MKSAAMKIKKTISFLKSYSPVNFIIGFLFHGPLFGKLWMKLANIHPTGNEKLSDMIPQMVKNFLANIVCAYVIGMKHADQPLLYVENI